MNKLTAVIYVDFESAKAAKDITEEEVIQVMFQKIANIRRAEFNREEPEGLDDYDVLPFIDVNETLAVPARY